MSFLNQKIKGSIPVGLLGGFSSLPVGTDGQVLTADSAMALGVKYATPSSGALGFRSTAISGALLVADGNGVVLSTGGALGITLTLPDPTLVAIIGKPINVKKVDAGVGAITVAQFAAETIDGATSITINSQYQSASIVSDGTNWHII